MICPSRGKADYLAEIFDLLTATQSIIFVNTRNFVMTLKKILNNKKCQATVMFGDMLPEERDEMMAKYYN